MFRFQCSVHPFLTPDTRNILPEYPRELVFFQHIRTENDLALHGAGLALTASCLFFIELNRGDETGREAGC